MTMGLCKIASSLLCVGYVLVVCVTFASSFLHHYPKFRTVPVTGDPGKALILTPLIEAGKIEEAVAASKVGELDGYNVPSYAGYFTVNKAYNSNLFFWFFPAENNYDSAPVVLWLQGGPGASSLYGLLTENGPYYLTTNNTLRQRKYSWSATHSVIYIDNPVGTGYSFTDSDTGYATNETTVGADLHSALTQFFQLFPKLQKNGFYITGESYAGKYVPAIAYTIHIKNPTAKVKINMQGLAIGNGLCDPEHMLKYGDYLYQLGLIDLQTREVFHQEEARGLKAIQEHKWEDAFEVFDELLNGDLYPYGSLFHNVTGFNYYFNYLHDTEDESGGDMGVFVQLDKTRRAIHVGTSTWSEGNKVEKYMKEDMMQSVRPWVEQLLEHYRVVIYNGQLDIIVAYPLTLGFLQNLEWSAAAEYRKAPRKQWHVGEELAGFSKTAGHLTEVLVRNAGHMVPSDQPRWALDLLNRLTSNKPF